MRRLTIILFFIGLIATGLKAESPVIIKADSAYMADEYATAVELYLQAIRDEGPSAKLYYNLGNSYFRLGEMGNSILSYERALRLDPTDKDIRENLAFANSKITDKAGERGTFLGNALDSAANSMRSDAWAWTAFAAFMLTVAGILVYLFLDNITLRKLGFFGAIVTFILCAVSLFLASRSAAMALADDTAVIVSPSTILSTAPRTPRDRSQEAMLLHEGTKLKILDSVSSTIDSVSTMWYDVQIDNAHRAWINSKDVEKIK